MGRRLATDVFVDDTRYLAGTSEADLAEVSTDVYVGGKKPQRVSVADRISNPAAWVDDEDGSESQSEPTAEEVVEPTAEPTAAEAPVDQGDSTPPPVDDNPPAA